MNKPLALAVRKELLLARAATERAELVRALDRFGQAREPFERIARLAAGSGQSNTANGLLGLFQFLRSHPYLGTAASLLFNRLRGTATGRWASRGWMIAAAVAGVTWWFGRKRTPD